MLTRAEPADVYEGTSVAAPPCFPESQILRGDAKMAKENQRKVQLFEKEKLWSAGNQSTDEKRINQARP